MLTKAFIPYRGYYSTPFSRWQGSMANEHAVILAGNTAYAVACFEQVAPFAAAPTSLGVVVCGNGIGAIGPAVKGPPQSSKRLDR